MAVDRYLNSTNYVHPQESNLLNEHKAMEYNAIAAKNANKKAVASLSWIEQR